MYAVTGSGVGRGSRRTEATPERGTSAPWRAWALLLWLPPLVVAASPFIIGAIGVPRASVPVIERTTHVCPGHARSQRAVRHATLIPVLELEAERRGSAIELGRTAQEPAHELPGSLQV